ncbi:MAG: insulinase family protein [Maricaulis sp.]|jgi:zinc protease|nr:insulinase family protein [Maricaulis sp.]MDG2043165.1 insulinase family protein [Maricaulis sp.]
MSRNRGLRALFVPVIFALGVAACQPADPVADAVWPHDVSDLAPDSAVRYGQLDNGLRYAILVNETPPNVASVRMVFNMGSLGEADDQRGVAHFIEHMAFNGTTNVAEGDMVPLLERYGLQFGPDTNAFTGREVVGYQLDLPETDDDSIDTALFLLRETASEMNLDAAAIDRERGVILSEERVRNTPIRRWQVALTSFRMPDTIIAERDPIGTVEVLENIQRDRFVDYYENFYTPERGMIVVTGSIDPDAIEAKIQTVFSDWQGLENARPDPDLGSVDFDRPFSVGYFSDPEVFTIMTIDAVRAYQPTADTAENRFQSNLANLGDAILGRRYATIVNSGTSPLLQVNTSHTSDFELVDRATVLAVATPDRWEDALAMTEQELRRALEHGFTQAELDEQITNMRSAMENSVEQAGTRDSSNLADAIWSSWRYDTVYTSPASSLERFEATVDDITVDAVNAAFRALWADTDPLIFLASSLELTDPEGAIRDTWAASQQVAVEPPVDSGPAVFAYTDFGTAGSIVEREEIEDLGLVRARFDNGVGVTFKQTDFEDGTVRIRVNFGRGELEPRAQPAVDVVTGNVFTASGLGAHSADDLSRVLAGRSVGTGFAVLDDRFRFSVVTTPEDYEIQLQLLAAFMTDPGWRAEGLAQYQTVTPEIRRNLYSTPNGVIQAEVSRMIHGGDARYGYPDPEEVAGIDIAAMQNYLMPALQNAPIEITVIGDIAEADAMAMIASTFGAFDARSAEWPSYDEARTIVFPDAISEPVVLRHNGPDYQGMANIYWPTDDDDDLRQTRAISLLRAVFDLKLTERLREDEGLTYSARINNTASDVYPDYGYMYVGADVQLEDIDTTYTAIRELAAELVAGGITDDEMLRARRPLLEQIEERFESNGWWMAWLSQSYSDRSRYDRVRTIIADYESITREELVTLAATYLRPETEWSVTIIPRATD